ncbi:hypothetical protein F4819DRAFT_279896 [Hypoxylon fuscum]|nr:hypothetical protein F4819DRAFT_279896 [Hypoxylon fuscum]
MSHNTPVAEQADTACKAEVKFHYFCHLPPNVRREIYILATPPRVVEIYEDTRGVEDERYDEYEKFKEMCRTTPVQFKLHPDIAYFAHNWAPQIASQLRSYARSSARYNLESYGFTSKKRRYQPWVPTKDVPEIPSGWLADHPDKAWHMTRSASLCSPDQIPSLLHVCSESRRMLMSYGYQLAFGTRTHGPRTWFHFERDTLYIERTPDGNGDREFLSGERWDVELFRPTDLQRVKKLALGGGFRFVSSCFTDLNIGSTGDGMPQIVNLLRLLPKVQELFFVEWDVYFINSWVSDLEGSKSQLLPFMKKECGIEPGFHIVCVPVDEVDVVTKLRPYDRYDQGYEDSVYSRLKRYKMQERSCTSERYFETEASRLRLRLSEEFQKIADSDSTRSSAAGIQKAPKISLVHMCSGYDAPYIFAMRRYFWTQFLDAKSKLKASKPWSEVIAYQDVGDVPDGDEWREYLLAHTDRDFRPPDFNLPITAKEEWWLHETFLHPPRFDTV